MDGIKREDTLMFAGKHNKSVICLWTLLGVCLLLQPVWAGSVLSLPDEPVPIVTHLKNDVANASASPIMWHLVVGQTDSGITRISFFTERFEKEICYLSIDPNGSIIGSSAILNQNVIQSEGIFLAPGFPAPCDILPIKQMTAGCPLSMVRDISKKIAGETFAYQIEIRCEPVSVDEAVREGWIRDADTISGPLKMVSVVNMQNRQLMVRQLWIDGDSWWLYEETAFRESWRMNVGE
jgi:hypothetical protein